MTYMDILDLRTLIDIGMYVLGMGITIAVIKTDIRWMRKWSDDHEKRDEDRFKATSDDIRELRQSLMGER